VPLVENEFNGNGRRVLIGHSFGGSYTLYSLMTDPGFFDAYIAVGSSTWVSGRALFDLAFAEKLDADPIDGLETHFEIIDETNHFTAVAPALISAVEKLYPVWGMDEEVRGIALNKGSDALDHWFEENQAKLGFRFLPPRMELEFMAINMASEGHGEAAKAIVNSLLVRNPESFTSFFALGFVYYHEGKFREAIEPFEKAAEFARAAGETPTLIARYERAAALVIRSQ
jgi:tetratricopeptide (TPR) repeat protein